MYLLLLLLECVDESGHSTFNQGWILWRWDVSWSAFHASSEDVSEDPPAIDVLLPMFYEKADTIAMVKHRMQVQMQITPFLNPGQIPVTAFTGSTSATEQPLTSLGRYLDRPVPNQTKMFQEQMALVGRKWRIRDSMCGQHYQRPQKPAVSFCWSTDANHNHCTREIVDAAKQDCLAPLCANVRDRVNINNYLHLYSGHSKCSPKYSIIILVCFTLNSTSHTKPILY